MKPTFLTKEERKQGIVLIPVKSMVRRYLLAHFGEVVHISSKNTCGQLMLALEIDIPDRPAPSIEESPLVYHKFKFAYRHVADEYREHQAQVWAGNYCWALFSNTMITWVDASIHAGRDGWNSLREFLESYGITEEEYALESAYRYFLKYRPYRVGEKPESLSA